MNYSVSRAIRRANFEAEAELLSCFLASAAGWAAGSAADSAVGVLFNARRSLFKFQLICGGTFKSRIRKALITIFTI